MSIWEDESLCTRCGACCHSKSGSPCEYLGYESTGEAMCRIYPNRLGWHRSLGGEPVECVTIEHEIKDGGGPDTCAYKKAYRESM